MSEGGLQGEGVTREVDPSLLTVYHLFVANAREMDIDYRKSFGQWLRSAVLQFFAEHPELIDLSEVFTLDEKTEMRKVL